MKLQVIRTYLRVFYKQMVFAVKSELAYLKDILSGFISSFSYNILWIVFLNIITSKMKSVGGYNLLEMYVFTFVSQSSFYIGLIWGQSGPSELIDRIIDGKLDTTLLKPISSLFLVITSNFRIIGTLIQTFPALCLYIFLVVKNGGFIPSPHNLVIAMIVFIIGQIMVVCSRYTWALPIFWLRNTRRIRNIYESLMEFNSYPFEAYPFAMKAVFTVFIPILVPTALSASYLLGKTTALWPIFGLFGVLFVHIGILVFLWNKGLARYGSASS